MLASCRPCARCPRSRHSSGCRGSFCPCSGGACCIARSAVAARCRLLVLPLGVHPGGGPPASAVRAASFARSVVSEHGQAPHSRRLPGLSETGCASVGAGCVRSETAGTIVGEKRPFLVHFSLTVVPRVSCVGWAGLAVVPWVSSARREQPEGAPGVRCLYLARAQDPRPRVQWPSGLPVGASHRASSTGYPHDSSCFDDNVADPYI